MKASLIIAMFLVAAPSMLRAQEAATDAAAEKSFSKASSTVEQKLDQSIEELNAVREKIAAEKIPLNRKLNDLEAELTAVRREFQETSRLLDSRTLDLTNLKNEIKSRKEEKNYLSTLFGQYVRNFESRLHIAEMQRYEEELEHAKLAPENKNLTDDEVWQAQLGLVFASLDRLYDDLGGTRFEGTAVDDTGLVKPGMFALVGPSALFRSEDGNVVGTAESRLNSLEPTVIAFENPEDTHAAANVVEGGAGAFPLDPTLGNAHKVESTKETLLEHISKGGVVMYPILGLAAAALLVALYKWISLTLTRNPSQRRIRKLLDAVAGKDKEAAMEEARKVGGPTGRMLADGVEHLDEPRELVEEVMYEEVLSTRLKLQRFLPFVAICAASAPLLGLLGTVTGIMNTFTLITVFGSGDVKTLSGGISEALITTEFGLIVAIPSLLLHAFLSRKARGMIDNMEKAAVALVNQIGKTPFSQPEKVPVEDTDE